MNSLRKEDQGGQNSPPPPAENALRGSGHLGEDIMRVMDFTNTESPLICSVRKLFKGGGWGYKVAMKLSA